MTERKRQLPIDSNLNRKTQTNEINFFDANDPIIKTIESAIIDSHISGGWLEEVIMMEARRIEELKRQKFKQDE